VVPDRRASSQATGIAIGANMWFPLIRYPAEIGH
jgi:hypothetical protein